MTAVLGMIVFAGAFAAAGSVFAFTLVPAMPRIAALLRGETDPAMTGTPVPALSERPSRIRARPAPAAAIAVRPQVLRAAA